MNYENICIRCMNEKPHKNAVCPFCGFDPGTYRQPPYSLPPMTILNGKYLLGEVLGSGGFGITYAALDLRLRRRVAIKEFFLRTEMHRDNPVSSGASYDSSVSYIDDRIVRISMEYFEKEAMLLAHVESLPGIVEVFELFNENRTLYIVMKYLEGVTLRDYTKMHGGRLHIHEVLDKLDSVMDSLAVLHDKNILHRDISPDNIMVLNNSEMKLFDFGGAKDLGNQALRQDTLMLRKKGFSPVEQIKNRSQGPWTDEYALAATIYYCITGSVPPDSVSRALGRDSLEKPSALGVDIRPATEAVLLKALSIRPENRYPGIREFKKALRASLPESHASGVKQYFGGRSETNGLRNYLLPVLSAVLGILLLASAVLIMRTVFSTGDDDAGLNPLYADSKPDSGTDSKPDSGTDSKPDSGTDSKPDSGTDSSSISRTDGIEWKDDSLESFIREMTGIYDRPVLYSDVAEITSLEVSPDYPVRDYSALSCFKSLTSLTVTDSTSIDVSTLKGLSSLTELSLTNKNGKKITDISPIGSLTNLTSLVLKHNDISDIEILGGLENLTFLDLKDNPMIEDITPIGRLTNLTLLGFASNGVKDLTPLKGLVHLNDLNLYDNEITDLTPIAGLTSLQRLFLSKNEISDLSPLEKLTDLRELTVSMNPMIRDYSVLGRMPKLRILYLSSNEIGDLAPLGSLTELRELGLSGNRFISDITPLKDLTNLRKLYLEENNISDISPLGELTELEELTLKGNPVRDYSPVEHLQLKHKDF